MGNHDKKAFHFKYYMNNPNAYAARFGSLQGGDYWFRQGDVLFLIYDSTNGSAYDHYRFTEAACKANRRQMACGDVPPRPSRQPRARKGL